MMLFSHLGLSRYPELFMLASIVATVVVSVLFSASIGAADKRLNI